MVHFFDVVVMKVSNTVHKTKQATRSTLARNRMLARLTKAAEQGAVLVTHDNAELMWLRRHVGPMISQSPSRICSAFNTIGVY